jgi:cysteine desulfurase/selenocysteine lyase
MTTTSDSGKDAARFPRVAFETVLPGGNVSVPAGLPDPGVLARMANEFFKSLPESSVPEQNAAGAPALNATLPGAADALGSAATVTSLPLNAIPSEAQLRALPESLAPGGAPSLVAGFSPAALPEIPGGIGAANFSALPSFSFLDEIRPLFS